MQSTISNRPEAVCHDGLFHPDDQVRRSSHEAYFGPSKNPTKLPEWFVAGATNPWQYISCTVLDNPLAGEQAVGLRIAYPEVRRWGMEELFESRCREGDFCLIHVIRNPVACFVSLRQAQKSGLWSRRPNTRPETCSPLPCHVDPTELTEFVREHMALRHRISGSCDDTLEVSYRDLFLSYNAVMQRVFDFLELPDTDVQPTPGCLRLRNRHITRRISNFAVLRSQVPSDVRQHLDSEDLL